MYGQKQVEEEKKQAPAPPQAGTQGRPLINIAPLAPVRLTYTGRAGAPSTQADRGAQRKIAGITHAVKQRQGPASLFHGQVTRELRQGQEVTIDERDVFLSRRGPNQELFREEDRQKKPSYRWYRLLAVGEAPVPAAEQPSYVRADTLVAPDRPLPEWGDATAPANRMGGRVTGLGVLSRGQRQLNRMGWLILESEREERPKDVRTTPHVSVTVYNRALLVQGNSDYPSISTVSPDRFSQLGHSERGMADDRKAKIARAQNRAKRLFGNYYETEVRADPLLGTAQRVLRGEDHAWRVSDQRTEKPVSEHGEMAVLEHIVREEEARVRREPAPRLRRRLRQLYIGGTLLDCLFCHWAFAIFNELMSKRYGLYVVTNGTHGCAPPHWVIPQWIQEDGRALERLRANLDAFNQNKEEELKREQQSKGGPRGKAAPKAQGGPPYQINGDTIDIRADLRCRMEDTIGDNSDSEA